MQRALKHLVILAAVAGVAWLAAPALSLDPYRPAASDFEQRMPAVERIDAPATRELASASGHEHPGPVTHLSDAIAAPGRFDLAGIAGEIRAYEIRARDDGGEWSEWIETANGDPVYFGGADELQLRARGWRPAGRLHYVNVSGTTNPTDSLLNGARSAINDAFISVASLLQPAAEAAPLRPDFVRRGEWGAKGQGGCHPRDTPAEGKVKAAVVHHTVTSGTYTPEEAPGIVLGICRFHRNGNGWNDIGYNALIDRYGTIYMGRAGGLGKAIVGAHAQGYNSLTTGVAAIGTHTKKPISEASLQSFAELLAWKLTHHDRSVRGKTRLRSAGGSSNRYKAGKRVRAKRIGGHLKLNLTACPGGALKTQIKEIRGRAAAIVGDKVPKPPPKEPPGGDSGGVGGG